MFFSSDRPSLPSGFAVQLRMLFAYVNSIDKLFVLRNHPSIFMPVIDVTTLNNTTEMRNSKHKKCPKLPTWSKVTRPPIATWAPNGHELGRSHYCGAFGETLSPICLVGLDTLNKKNLEAVKLLTSALMFHRATILAQKSDKKIESCSHLVSDDNK